MKYSNDFEGKKKMVKALAEVYKDIAWSDIADIELKKYRKGNKEDEFIVLTWINGGISTANNNMNSLSATARNVARMLDGGVYENLDYYKDIMSNEDWEEVRGNNINKFENNLIETKELHGGVQKIFKFDNMYGASVIKHKYSYGGDLGLWELAVIKFQADDKWDIVYDTGITEDVIGYLTDDDVCDLLEQIKQL